MMTDSIVALKPLAIGNIEYQVTLILKNDNTYLNSVNILFKNKIIKKIKKTEENIPYSEKAVTNILDNFFLQIFSVQKNHKPKKDYKNKKAKQKAAQNLMNDLKL